MGSRIRSSSDQLLVCWCEVVGGEGRDQPPWIIQKFPNTYDDTETLKIIPQFVFPCMIERNAVQNFSFVLTSVESTFTFGYCRHSPTSNSAMVILSYLPWDSTFYKILKQCSEIQSSQSPDDMWLFLQALYHSPVPEPGSKLTVCYPPNNSMFIADCPNHLGLPSIPEDRNLMEYYSAVDANTMMLIFASMLFERRILVSSRQLHRLSSCVQAANALLYPMTWQHIFIPVLPESMLEYLHAPMPFLIGVPQSLMEKVHLDEIGEVVYLDADANKCLTPFKDLDELPNEVASYLTRKLNPREKTMDDSVPRAFLRALVMLIGNYQDALQIHEGNKRIVFNHEKFIAGRPQNVKSFVVKMLELQIFNQFIEERIDRLSNGLATSDEFEMELSVYGDKHPRRNFMQAIKNFKSKTNPAMKSAAKTVARTSKQVKERGKEIKGMLPKLPHSKSPEHSSNRDPELRSAPSSPVAPKRRPNTTMFVPNVSYTRSNTTLPNTRKSHSTPAALSPESPHPPSIDLMGELQQELQNILPDRPPPPPSSSSSSSSRPLTRPTTLPPPIPTSSAAVSSPSKGLTIPNSGKMTGSASLTSLPTIDVSLNIELPPPITSQILPITDYHYYYNQSLATTASDQHKLPYRHTNTLPSQHSDGARDHSYRHMYRSPRPYDLTTTTTKTISSAASTSSSSNATSSSSRTTHYSTLPRVPSCESPQASSNTPAGVDDDVVLSLYGTAQQFRTRIIGAATDTSPYNNATLNCDLPHRKSLAAAAQKTSVLPVTALNSTHSLYNKPSLCHITPTATITNINMHNNKHSFLRQNQAQSNKNDYSNCVDRPHLDINKYGSDSSKFSHGAQNGSNIIKNRNDDINIPRGTAAHVNKTVSLSNTSTSIPKTSLAEVTQNSYKSAYADRVARQEIKTSTKGEQSPAVQARIDDINLPQTKFRSVVQSTNQTHSGIDINTSSSHTTNHSNVDSDADAKKTTNDETKHKDEDLILLGGSPQDEVDDFDPLLSKSVSNADTSSSSSTTPHPLHSFLHSNLHKHVSDSQPYSSLPSHISRPSYGQPLGIPFTSAPSPSSTTHPSLPRTVSSPSAAQSSAGAAGAAQKSSRRSSVQPSDHRSSSTMGGAARAVLSSTAPSLPVPVRKGSTPSRNHQGASSTIPSATMAALPAALQQHLASKLDSSSSSSSNPSNFTPFASLQSTSPRPPLMQTNPAYNNHVPPQQSSSRSAAAMFASSLLDAGSDAHVSNNIVNINNNNETAASKHLLSEFSDTFAQMSLNKKECEVKVEPAPTKHNWMSFE